MNKQELIFLVEKAIVKQRALKELQEELEGIKETFRGEALKRAKRKKSDELVEFPSPLGTVTVCFPDDSVKLTDEKKAIALVDTLPKETWGKLYEFEVSLTKSFKETLETLPVTQKLEVVSTVTFKPVAPRVTIAK